MSRLELITMDIFRNMKIKTILLAALTFSLSAAAQQTNPLLKNEAKITEIIKGMTLEEKVNMLHGKNMFSSADLPLKTEVTL